MVPPPMTSPRNEKIYLAAVVLVFAGLGLLRADLIAGAFRATLMNLSSGWVPAIKITAKVLLLGGIVILTLRTIPRRIEPATDCLVVLIASIFGYAAEAWGVHSGLWTYYTGEKPPLWIIPAWPLGALVIKSLSASVQAEFGGLIEKLDLDRLYWVWVILFYCVFIPFIAVKLSPAACFAALLLTAAVLFSGGKTRSADALVLLTGTVCVFWADLWGTTNHCWTYHTQTARFGLAYGILFGMFFDSVVVLAAIKAAVRLRRLVLT